MKYHFLFRFLFTVIFSLIFSLLILLILYPLFSADSVLVPFSLNSLDIAKTQPTAWLYLKVSYSISLFICLLIISNSLFNVFIYKKLPSKRNFSNSASPKGFFLYVGNDSKTHEKKYIEENGLYQNILITGTIGSGKTSSVMYPFTEQLISYSKHNPYEKLGMLILDVKGNFYKEVKKYACINNRLDDLIIIELGNNITYNPLDKPNLKASVLANRLKNILTLFSSNNSDSYWLDKVEQVLTESIKLCRLYNNGYVTFVELDKLINSRNYYLEKIKYLKELFQSAKLSSEDIYNLSTAIDFFEKEFINLDSRVLSILKSEITRITQTFISDYEILKTFSPTKEDINFHGFKDVIEKGKIVVLNMNISEYRNLSKILAAYLKLDFQSEILMQLSSKVQRKTAFICDEFHEYITTTDADFFAQSRESKCINIVATQSYSSLLNTLKETSTLKVIIQNLVNKFWLRTDDTFTIEEIQKQIGKEDKIKISKNISENASSTNYNYFTNSLYSKNSSLSESINSYVHTDYIYDTKFFTQELETFTCLSFISNGYKILPPCKLSLTPSFLTPSPKISSSKYKII